MANTKSAIKRIRRISRQTVVNKTRKSRFRNSIKKMNLILKNKNKKEALEFLPKLNGEHSGYCWTAFESWPKNLHAGLRNTLNNKSIKGKLQTILDLIT